MAALSGHAEAVWALVKAGADPDPRTKHGNTPLHQAAYSGHAEAIGALLKGGADPGARDDNGNTALDLIPGDSPLVGTALYRRLNDARWD